MKKLEELFQVPSRSGNTLRCTIPSCGCANFAPATANQRECSSCCHGWIPHAEDKLHHGIADLLVAPQPINVDIVFDLASLILYGSQAIPIKLKILLDKLFARLQHNEVLQEMHSYFPGLKIVPRLAIS